MAATTREPLLNRTLVPLYDRLEHAWETRTWRVTVANLLVLTLLGALALIELNRLGMLPDWLYPYFHATNPFTAVSLAFTMLLVFEVVELVFAMVHSVATAVGKQFEILSLILLRQAFKAFGDLSRPYDWEHIGEPMGHIVSDAVGALLLFLALGLFYRMLRHQAITANETEQTRFIATKKLLALVLLVVFAALFAHAVIRFLRTAESPSVFPTLYTILIFADFLLVLISMRYSGTYHVLFRNSGFALVTLLIRVALSSPPYVNVVLGVVAAVFCLGLVWAYNRFLPDLARE